MPDENKYNKSVLETRFLYTTSVDNPEMMQATAISADQADLAQKTLNFQGYKVGLISSMPVAISNLISESEKNNIAAIMLALKLGGRESFAIEGFRCFEI